MALGKLREAWLRFSSGEWGSEEHLLPQVVERADGRNPYRVLIVCQAPRWGLYFKEENGSQKIFCDFLNAKAKATTHWVENPSCCLGGLFPFQFLKEMKLFHTCGTLDSWGVDQILHCLLLRIFRAWVYHCWPRATKMSVTSPSAAGHHPEKTAQEQSPALWGSASLVMVISEDSRLLIQGCEWLFIQTGIISWRELCVNRCIVIGFQFITWSCDLVLWNSKDIV